MWLCFNDGFYSIVAKPEGMTVRARSRKHLRAFLKHVPKDCKWAIKATPNADYGFRVVLPARVVATVIAQRVQDINYDNFKDSVEETRLHDMYALWWNDHYDYQNQKGAYTAPTGNKQSKYHGY